MNLTNETFAEFVLNNKEGIIKKCTTSINRSSNSLSGKKIETVTRYSYDIVNKWSKLISTGSASLSTDFMETICFFCEVVSIYDERCRMSMSYSDVNLDTELKLIYERILKHKHRSKIIEEYYNYHTGKTEYLLEDGSFVPTGGGLPTINMDYKYFPTEFLPLLNESEYRNAKIDQII